MVLVLLIVVVVVAVTVVVVMAVVVVVLHRIDLGLSSLIDSAMIKTYQSLTKTSAHAGRSGGKSQITIKNLPISSNFLDLNMLSSHP